MWPWRLIIRVVLWSDSQNTSLLNDIEKLLCTANVLLIQTNNIDISFFVFSDLQKVSIVQQIIEFSTVNFVKCDCYLLRLVLRQLQIVKNFLGTKVVNSWHSLCHITFHSISLSWTSLSVSKTWYLGALKCIFDQRSNWLLINLLIMGILIIGIIEIEGSLFHVLSEINLLPI